MRTILGALIGLGLGVALIAVLAVSGGWDGYWTMIPVGLIVGVAMRAIASSGNASIGRGVLALVAALGAMPLGQMVSANIISNQAPTTGAIPSVVADADSQEDADAEAPAVAEEPVAEVAERSVPTESRPVGSIGAPQASTTSPIDIVCLVIGALLSYQIGKGPEGAQEASTEGEGAGEGEGQPDDGGDASEGDDSGEQQS